MKKGISLIVLVITIIVLAILAGAIIISLSNTNIIEQATNAVTDADLANARNAATLAYAAAVARSTTGVALDASGNVMDADDYKAALTAAGFNAASYTVSVDENNMGIPTVTK